MIAGIVAERNRAEYIAFAWTFERTRLVTYGTRSPGE
jgi:hypothetical protein